jgi:ketosteroid isomerase-like protein
MEPVEVVRDQFDAVNERDFQRAMDRYADDVVLVVGRDVFLIAGTFKGKDAVGEWFGDWFRAFGTDYRFEIIEARQLDDGLVHIYASYGGSGRASGAKATADAGWLYRVEDEKVKRVQLFLTQEEALEAAKLPEWSDPETD